MASQVDAHGIRSLRGAQRTGPVLQSDASHQRRRPFNHTGYTTDVITDQALKWLDHRDRTKPFFLMCQHKAPHGKWEPALRHLEAFDGIEIPEPKTLFDDYSGRSKAPSWSCHGNCRTPWSKPVDVPLLQQIHFQNSSEGVRCALRTAQRGRPERKLTGKERTTLELSAIHQELSAMRQGRRREHRPHAQVSG